MWKFKIEIENDKNDMQFNRAALVVAASMLLPIMHFSSHRNSSSYDDLDSLQDVTKGNFYE